MEKLTYEHQVVIITGAGAGLGKAYALFFASRGACVVVNDLGSSSSGAGNSTKAADKVVNEIIRAGGKAIANYDSVEYGEKIVQTAIDSFGRIDVIINNAGILRDVSFKKMTDNDWDLIFGVHVTGAYKCVKAAWPYFQKQRYGRIINTSSAAGIFGNFGQTNYSAAKHALIGFSNTLAKEGLQYNIIVNTIAPVAASRLTATVMPAEVLENLTPDWVVPLVAILVHRSNTTETGGVFEAGGGHMAKLRWHQSRGLSIKTDGLLTPGTVLENFSKITDLSSDSEHQSKLQMDPNPQLKTNEAVVNETTKEPQFKGKVVLITAAATDLGRAFAYMFAKLGSKVVVHDIVDPDSVVKEIKASGGVAFGVKETSVHLIVKACIDNFGRIDVLINHVDTRHDSTFSDMANITDNMWRSIMSTYLFASYKLTKAIWQYMLNQKYGRIINTTSTRGIYGNFGQASYASAAAGVIGLTRALAREGHKYNIHVNAVALDASKDTTQALRPLHVSALVIALCSDDPSVQTGGLYELGSRWIALRRWQRSGGYDFPLDTRISAEAVLEVFPKIIDFDDGRADYPQSSEDGLARVMTNIQQLRNVSNIPQNIPTANKRTLDQLEAAKGAESPSYEFAYDDRDVILYNIGVGARRTELSLVYENNRSFEVLPTFGANPQYFAIAPYRMEDLLPNFNYMKLLHGEQYLEIPQYPIPTTAVLQSKAKLIEVLDKGNAALLRTAITTTDPKTSRIVFYSEMLSFIRGSGGFGGASKAEERGAATAENKPPSRKPDYVQEETTSLDQAALYRLSGDRNPLHIDPEASALGGFQVPILHGLCFFGISGKHVYQKFGPYKNIKVRFSGTVLPGQTLLTEMWKQGHKVIYQVRVKETGKLCISNAAVELVTGGASSL